MPLFRPEGRKSRDSRPYRAEERTEFSTREERIRYLDAKPFFDEMCDLSDEQLIDFIAFGDDQGDTRTYRMTAGDLRRKLDEGIERTDFGVELAITPNDELEEEGAYPEYINLSCQAYQEIRVITDEMLRKEVERDAVLSQIDELAALGVDRELFLRVNQRGTVVRFTPDQVIEYARILVRWKLKKERNEK
jgi:hypothetical protein